MISTIIKTLEQGFKVMRLNSRLLMVGILVFVFPVLFLWITQSFFTTAYSNIDSSQKLRVSMLHDSLQVVLREVSNSDVVLPKLLTQYGQENSDISQIRIVEPKSDGALVVFSLNQTEVGTSLSSETSFQNLPLSNTGEALIYPVMVDGVRTWQVFSTIEDNETTYTIFSEHTFGLIDSVMIARQQLSYLGLSAIFLFLISLAYWLNKQMQWEKSYQKLSKQMAERDLFSNMITHEFRSPLTAIKGYASFLAESGNLTSEEKRFATNIRVSAERLVLLVNDFLEVARLQSGKLELKRESVDVRDVLTKVADDLRMTAIDKGLRLIYEPPEQPVMLQTDGGRLNQIITNLVSNSIKYTEAGVVELECHAEGGAITISINDTGVGISAADQKKLFAPFERFGEADKSITVGSGLGMWTTKQFITLLGGKIGVESIKKVGTHVVITLPVDLNTEQKHV